MNKNRLQSHISYANIDKRVKNTFPKNLQGGAANVQEMRSVRQGSDIRKHGFSLNDPYKT